MKAYYIYVKNDDYYEYSDITHGDTPGQAKSRAYFFCDVDFTDIRAKRIPALDDTLYPTDKQIFEAGFCISCTECHNRQVFNPTFDKEGFGFCDEVCHSRWRVKLNARLKARKN